MAVWVIWLIAAGLFTGAEIFTLDFVLLMFGGGAAAAVVPAALGAPVLVQLIVFAVVALGLLAVVRPIAKKHLTVQTPRQIDGVAVYLGRTGLVTVRVDEHRGRVRIDGDEWSAVSQTAVEQFEIGTKVRVMAIRGATAVVSADLV